jgi:imidazolonepropionase-like amidohydrolase
LQSVTSVPAKSLELDHRIGYVRPGYDADIVIWNSHPLSVGATPLQVYIDGKSTLDPKMVAETLPQVKEASQKQVEKLKMRTLPEAAIKEDICRAFRANAGETVTIMGIKKSFLDWPTSKLSSEDNLAMVLEDGKLVCLGSQDTCVSSNSQSAIIKLENGHILPGLTALSSVLGLAEITGVEETKDGTVSKSANPLNADNVVYAKYGVHLDGKAFKRARIGGVTRAITAPITDTELLGGVSVGIKTSGKKTILDGGYFKEDVALHFIIGQEDKGKSCMAPITDELCLY